MLLVSAEVNVPVIGGHAGVTILPLFSQVTSQFLSIWLNVLFVTCSSSHSVCKQCRPLLKPTCQVMYSQPSPSVLKMEVQKLWRLKQEKVQLHCLWRKCYATLAFS